MRQVSACGSLVVCEQARDLVLFHQPYRVYGAWLRFLLATSGVLSALLSVVFLVLWIRDSAFPLWMAALAVVAALACWRVFLVLSDLVHHALDPDEIVLRLDLEDRVAYWADGEVVGAFGELEFSTKQGFVGNTLLLTVRNERFALGSGDVLAGSIEFVKTQLERHLEPEFDTLVSMLGSQVV